MFGRMATFPWDKALYLYNLIRFRVNQAYILFSSRLAEWGVGMMRRVLMCLLFGLVSVPVHAAVKAIGQGESMRLDPTGFPPDMKAAYAVMQAKCTQCHSLERTCVAVTTGVAPISGRPFDRAAVSAYGQKMLRKQNAGMSKDEVKVIVDLLSYLIDNTNSKKQ